jgi:hypothetical protein
VKDFFTTLEKTEHGNLNALSIAECLAGNSIIPPLMRRDPKV